MASWAQAELSERPSRCRDQITRIEVHLSDENAGRSGDADKRCTLQARLAGRPLDADLGRIRDAGGRVTIRGGALS